MAGENNTLDRLTPILLRNSRLDIGAVN